MAERIHQIGAAIPRIVPGGVGRETMAGQKQQIPRAQPIPLVERKAQLVTWCLATYWPLSRKIGADGENIVGR
jgi:hypothetical protein